jgi:4-hydroxybutyryl-CoA dehydratase/vinylacetyl-CoA-Delta-isomerase
MPIKTPVEYVESLRALKINAYVGVEKVTSAVDHPAIAPHINTVSKIYELAQNPEHKGLITTKSHLTGREINRFTHIFQSTDDLLCKIKMLRLLGQTTGTCFQRCVGLDAMNATYAISYEIDEAKGTDYHQRFKN